MLAVYVCVDTWMNTSYKCFQGLHLAAVIASTFIALALAAFSFIGTCSGEGGGGDRDRLDRQRLSSMSSVLCGVVLPWGCGVNGGRAG